MGLSGSHSAFETSLQRLGTDSLDLSLIHCPKHSNPLDATFETLNQVDNTGKVIYLGLSNFYLNQLKMAQSLADAQPGTNQASFILNNQ